MVAFELRPEGPTDDVEPPPARPLLWLLQHGLVGALAIALAIAAATLVLDWFLLSQRKSRPIVMAFISDGILAVVAFFLLWRLMRFARQQQQRIVERLEIIDQMNHHIRNALQVISFNVRIAANDQNLEEIRRGVERIHWTLRELLPRVEPKYEPFERLPGESKPE